MRIASVRIWSWILEVNASYEVWYGEGFYLVLYCKTVNMAIVENWVIAELLNEDQTLWLESAGANYTDRATSNFSG
jgi:hypothetical protein